MATEANRDAADQSLDIAKYALAAGNLDKAQRFADKAMKLYPSDEVRKVTIQINSRRGSAPPSAPSSAPSSSSGPRARPSASSNGPALPVRENDNSTPEQRELVKNIRKTKDFYEILGIAKTASDDDIKRAYRKLALKLHPDKNQAKGADEAFKAVSKAFSCLSNADNRAAYDRYGDQEGAAGFSGQGRAGPTGQGFGGDGFDAEELFNMFFGNGFGARPGAGANVYRHNFGGPPRGTPRQQGGQQQGNPMQGLLHIIPVVILLLFTFLSSPSEPAFSLDRTSGFSDQMVTRISSVPFFVKNQHEFEQKHPIGKRDRQRVESEVERSYMERLQQVCYREQMHQQQLFRWGQKDKARKMEMPSCAELNAKFGFQYSSHVY